jgi:hypothetical protein
MRLIAGFSLGPEQRREVMFANKKRPPFVRGPKYQKNNYRKLYHKKSPKKRSLSKRIILPEPESFYQEIFQEFERKSGKLLVKCCFHGEKTSSLYLYLESGGFYCFGCEASGGDIIAFVMMHREISYRDALREFEVTR